MSYLQLVSWSPARAEERAARLRAGGHEVVVGGDWSEPLPDALVVDLSSRPSHGREVAAAWAGRKATRDVPLVFVGGAPEKVERAREQFPMASFAPEELGEAFEAALARNARGGRFAARRRDGAPAGISRPPLPRKLGIAPGMRVLLAGAPPGVEATLGTLPAGARLTREPRRRVDLALWFVTARAPLERGFARMAARPATGRLWILWPKRASSLAGELAREDVRAAGLAAGLVDVKVCAFDADWSGLLFTPRAAPRGLSPD